MALFDQIIDAIRARLGQPPRQAKKSYGSPGKVLTDHTRDYEVASADIAADLDRAFPDEFTARLRSGFDPNRDYNGRRCGGCARNIR